MKNYAKKSLKTSNGITLIALVITIIVLLILAGISISMLSGDNGILQRAKQSKERTEKATIIELAQTEILGQIAENKGETISEAQLKTILNKYFEEFDDRLPEDLSKTTITLTVKNEYGGYDNIALVDIYNGKLKKEVLEPGLYDATTGVLKKAWDKLIQEDLIKVENGVVSPGANSDRVNILSGKIVFPNDITEFANGTFNGCAGLTGDLIIPNSVTKIGHGAFGLCTNLTGRVVIPNSVKTLGNSCFARCGSSNSLESLEIDITTIPDNVYPFAEIKASNLVIGNNCTTIGDGAFEACSAIKGNLTIPSSVATIGNRAFNGCTGFDRITIQNTTMTIGSDAFKSVADVYYNGSATGSPWGAKKLNGTEVN